MDRQQRVILHVDVDAFFPSVEQLLIPALRGRPVVVGNGVIASCSYEARAAGLHAGMALREARRRCARAIFLDGRQAIYKCFADHVWEVCRRYTCGLETYLDEAYGDATGVPGGAPVALGQSLQRDVRDEVGLPVSVGLAANRMMAKIASASAKPGGVAWVAPGEEEAFLAKLPVAKLLGVGPKTARRLRDMNIRTVADLRRLPRETLGGMFGRRGLTLYDRCRGQDPQRLRPAALPRTISRETTFHQATCDRGEMRGMLFYLLERATRAVRSAELLTRTVEVSIRYEDWKSYTASRSLPGPSADDDELYAVALELLERLHGRRVALRHVGVVLSNFTRASEEGMLFAPEACVRRRSLHGAVDRIRDRWGHATIVTGESIDLLGKLQQNDYGFVLRTPSLTK